MKCQDETTQTEVEGEESESVFIKKNLPRDSQGFEIVRINKSQATLGLVFEGGIDTTQKIPRIINLTTEGAAAKCGDLRVGQLIRMVDGKSVEGIQVQLHFLTPYETMYHNYLNSWLYSHHCQPQNILAVFIHFLEALLLENFQV